jgi:glucose repression mediator protein
MSPCISLLFAGAVSEQLGDTDRADAAYEHALRHNPGSVSALTQVAGMARVKEDFHRVSSSQSLAWTK